MKFQVCLLLLSLSAASCLGGDYDFGKQPVPDKNYVIDPAVEEELGFYIPGFLPWADATIGVKGVETTTQFGGDVLLKNLNMIALAGLEGRKGKWGFILEGMYLDLGATGGTPGRLLSSVDIGFEQLIAEATATYRIHESDRGFVELLAGARYYWLGTDLTLNLDPGGVKAVSQDISQTIVNRASSAVSRELNQRLAAELAGLPTADADLTTGALNNFNGRIQNQVDAVRKVIGQSIRSDIGAERSVLGNNIGNSGPIRELIRDYARAKLIASIEQRRAQASAAVAAARQGARANAQRALTRAEKKLARGLQKAINQTIPNETLSASKGWVDPIIGIRGKMLINDDLYFVARADYGGFGVSSDVNYNLYGALGTQLKENTTLEIGIRHMGVEYEHGFKYDASFTGPFSAVMIHF